MLQTTSNLEFPIVMQQLEFTPLPSNPSSPVKTVPKYKQLDTCMKGPYILLSNNNLTINVPKDWGQSILCMEFIPLEGTHSFTATH